jgi:hypothetical protein
MKLEGTYTFDAPQAEVWKALMDPETLKAIMPGCEELTQTGQDEYKAALKIKVGPVQGNFQGNVKLSDINEPDSYTMQVDGKGPAGFMKGVGGVKLEAQGESTVMHYSGDAQVGGRIASVGQRLLDSSAKALTRQSLDGLHEIIKADVQGQTQPQPAAPTTANSNGTPARPRPTPSIKAPSQTEFALGVAKNMAEDLVPPERRPAVIAGAAAAFILLMLLNWWVKSVARQAAEEVIERRNY